MGLQLPFPKIEKHRIGSLSVLTDAALLDACGVRIAFTSREGGVSEGCFESLNCGAEIGDDDLNVQRNRDIVRNCMGAPDAPMIVARQVHGTHLVYVACAQEADEAAAMASQGADGVVVGSSRVCALLNFADCLPLIIVSPSGRFAVIHAGWRGTIAHIAREAVSFLAQDDPRDPSAFNAYIGPHIRQECFEVSEQLATNFLAEFGEQAVPDARHVSLSGAVALDLIQSGLDARRIADALICTKCRPHEYFSYRATNGSCGRHSAFACRF